MSSNVTYEEITCSGYNPDTEILEAVFSVKQPVGCNGDLCKNGSFEYLRFYLDFDDGAGFIDQYLMAVNVRDIPQSNDCEKKTILPLKYAAVLPKKTDKFSEYDHSVLPALRVILSWETEPTANSYDWPPPWGDVFNCEIQLKPTPMFVKQPIDIAKYLQLAFDPDFTAVTLHTTFTKYQS